MSNKSTNPNPAPRWLLQNDGIDHINIYSKGRTPLGRMLSHFAHMPFVHPFHGRFTSMEGFWYYMRSPERDDKLRYMHGFAAKKHGRTLTPLWYEGFKDDILAANYQKIIQNPELLDLLVRSELPFSHYYTFQPEHIRATAPDKNTGLILINARDADWLIQGLEDIRESLRRDEVPACWERVQERNVATIIGAKEDAPKDEGQP